MSNFFWELLAARFFWDSKRSNLNVNYIALTFTLVNINTIGANLCVTARLCVPSPPTEGWFHPCWQVLSVPCGSLRSLSYRFLQVCVAFPSWPLTSRPLLMTLVHLGHTHTHTCSTLSSNSGRLHLCATSNNVWQTQICSSYLQCRLLHCWGMQTFWFWWQTDGMNLSSCVVLVQHIQNLQESYKTVLLCWHEILDLSTFLCA